MFDLINEETTFDSTESVDQELTTLSKTDQYESEIDKYTERYRSFSKKSASSTLEIAKIIEQAKEDLVDRDFQKFCEIVKIDISDSTLRKMNIIARNAARFESCLERMPASWTTIYKLASIDAAKFEKLVDDDIINPLMTARELATHIDKKGPRGTKIVYDIKISTEELTDDMQKEFQENFKQLLNEYPTIKHWQVSVKSDVNDESDRSA